MRRMRRQTWNDIDAPPDPGCHEDGGKMKEIDFTGFQGTGVLKPNDMVKHLERWGFKVVKTQVSECESAE